jgi:oligosaccharide repeat unit polymerase
LVVAALLTAGTGGRWPLVMSGLAAIMIGLYVRRRSGLTALSYVAILMGLPIFVVMGQNRDALVNFLVTGKFDFDFDLAKTSFGAHPDLANFEFLTFVIAKVPLVSETYSYFTQYLGVFTWPIPRMLWPDKPVGSPITLVNLQDYGQFASRTTSLVGDGWISLGYPGVVITLVLAGALYGYLYKQICRRSVSSFHICAYVWMVALLAQWARDGGYRILEFYFFCVTPVGLAYVISLVLSRQRYSLPARRPASRPVADKRYAGPEVR